MQWDGNIYFFCTILPKAPSWSSFVFVSCFYLFFSTLLIFKTVLAYLNSLHSLDLSSLKFYFTSFDLFHSIVCIEILTDYNCSGQLKQFASRREIFGSPPAPPSLHKWRNKGCTQWHRGREPARNFKKKCDFMTCDL